MTEEPATTDHPIESDRAITEAVAPAENVITAPAKKRSKGPSIIETKTGAIGSPHAEHIFDKPEAVEEPEEEIEKAAVWSEKNVRWSGVGTLTKGYNVVTKEAAEKWATMKGIRVATPEEVAAHYGK